MHKSKLESWIALFLIAGSSGCFVADAVASRIEPSSSPKGGGEAASSTTLRSERLADRVETAERLLANKDYSGAHGVAKEALEYDPNNARAQSVIAEVKRIMKARDEAQAAWHLYREGRCTEALPQLKTLDGNPEADPARIKTAIAECEEIAVVDATPDDVKAVRGLWGLWWKSKSPLPRSFQKPLALTAANARIKRMDAAVGDEKRIASMYRGVDAPIRYLTTVQSLFACDMPFKPQTESMLAEFAAANGSFRVGNGPTVKALHEIWKQASRQNEALIFFRDSLRKHGPGTDGSNEKAVVLFESRWEKTLAPLYPLAQ